MLELDYARRSQRRAVELSCELIERTWDAPIRHEVKDISARGMWVRTSFPLPIGDHVVVSLPGEIAFGRGEMMVFARVTRAAHRRDRGRHGMALEFIDLSKTERRTLASWLRAQPRKRGGTPKPPPVLS